MTRPRCDRCPVAEGLACVADAALCRLAGSPEWDHAIREHSRIARGEPAPAVVAPPAAPAAPPVDPAVDAAARACPHRDAVGTCGCDAVLCLPGGRRALEVVRLADCRACVGAGRPDAA